MKSPIMEEAKSHHSKMSNTCVVCNKTFPRKGKLTRHLKTHSREKPYSCSFCHKTFPSRYHCNRHIKTHSREPSYKCHVCKQTFSSETAKIEHVHLHTDSREKLYSCSVCDKSFPSHYHYSRHMKTHSREPSYKCRVCKQTFSSKTAKLQHIHLKTHSREKPYSCSVCDKSFPSQYHCNRHMKSHSGQAAYRCHVCKQTFSSETARMAHMESHPGETLPSCTVCGKTFETSDSLKKHCVELAGKVEYGCLLCKETFLHQSLLAIHMRMHAGETPCLCSVCSVTFPHGSSFDTHMKVHTYKMKHHDLDKQNNGKEFETGCLVCKKKFLQPSTLALHMKQHTGESPHTCNICSVTFPDKSSLDSHMTIHTFKTELEPLCYICKKRFSSKSELANHMPEHQAEKLPYCMHCNKYYRSEMEMKTDPGSPNPLLCSVCDSRLIPLAVPAVKVMDGSAAGNRNMNKTNRDTALNITDKGSLKKKVVMAEETDITHSGVNSSEIKGSPESSQEDDDTLVNKSLTCAADTASIVDCSTDRPSLNRKEKEISANTAGDSCNAWIKVVGNIFRRSDENSADGMLSATTDKVISPERIRCGVGTQESTSSADRLLPQTLATDAGVISSHDAEKKDVEHTETNMGNEREKTTFVCSVCKKSIPSVATLLSHMKNHESDNPFINKRKTTPFLAYYVGDVNVNFKNNFVEEGNQAVDKEAKGEDMMTGTDSNLKASCNLEICARSQEFLTSNFKDEGVGEPASCSGSNMDFSKIERGKRQNLCTDLHNRSHSMELVEPSVQTMKGTVGTSVISLTKQISTHSGSLSRHFAHFLSNIFLSSERMYHCCICSKSPSAEPVVVDVDTDVVLCETCVWTCVPCALCEERVTLFNLRKHLTQHTGEMGYFTLDGPEPSSSADSGSTRVYKRSFTHMGNVKSTLSISDMREQSPWARCTKQP